jgi:hypothetical protein
LNDRLAIKRSSLVEPPSLTWRVARRARAELGTERRVVTEYFRSLDRTLEVRNYVGLTRTAFESLDPDGQRAFAADLLKFFATTIESMTARPPSSSNTSKRWRHCADVSKRSADDGRRSRPELFEEGRRPQPSAALPPSEPGSRRLPFPVDERAVVLRLGIDQRMRDRRARARKKPQTAGGWLPIRELARLTTT